MTPITFRTFPLKVRFLEIYSFVNSFFPNFGWTVKSISKARCQGNALSKERS